MNAPTSLFQNHLALRSTGSKLIVICLLALLMMIPAFFVWLTVQDRTRRAEDVTAEISRQVGGQQTFLGPTLAIPYALPFVDPAAPNRTGTYLVFPAHALATIKTATQERRRSLFKVPVFQADLNMESTFDLAGVPSDAPAGAQLDWTRAEIIVGVSDPRGAAADAVLKAGSQTATLTPAQTSPGISFGSNGESKHLTLFGTPAADLAKPNARFTVSAVLHFSGAKHIAVLAYGKTTQIDMQGDWPSPGFDGGFLPARRSITPNGYTAEWTIPFIARGVRAEGPSDSLAGLDATAAGLDFVEVADPYQSVNRALKYTPLFVGLVFVTYFLFETTSGKRLHPAQYLLVGLAQTIFYLLLVSLAERLGFDLAFLIGGAATVALLSANAAWIFASSKQGLRALAVFAPLYALIYTLLRLEDDALLVGAVASFLAIAAVMYFTRTIDWYTALPGDDSHSPANAA